MILCDNPVFQNRGGVHLERGVAYRFETDEICFGQNNLIPVYQEMSKTMGPKMINILRNEFHSGTIGAKGVEGDHLPFNHCTSMVGLRQPQRRALDS